MPMLFIFVIFVPELLIYLNQLNFMSELLPYFIFRYYISHVAYEYG